MASARLDERPEETRRLAALRRYRILDSLPEPVYDDVVRLASVVCGTPQAVVTFIEDTRQWFKASVGIDGEETPRAIAFCDQAIRRPGEVTVVNDASVHPLFHNYPQVTGPDHLRFYAGAPMVTPDGHALGTVCVIDQVPREISGAQVAALQSLARIVVQLLEMRRGQLDAQRQLAERELVTQNLLRSQSELEARNSELSRQAHQDPLTGLLNRAGMQRAAASASAGWASSGNFCVAVLDIDHFKRINDGFGHAAGDSVIQAVAEAIRRNVRGGDIAVRYGGEEFLVMMPATPAAGARTVIERIRSDVSALAGLPVPVTVSAGLAMGQAGRDEPEAVFRAADQALYLAKRRGRDRVEVAED
jgi:diguanylate cyclase (GGDEF)-like protein